MILPIIVETCLLGPVAERLVAPWGRSCTSSAPICRGEILSAPAYEVVEFDGCPIPVARDLRTRLRGLAWRHRSRAGAGLLIPRCSSVHTFGMRFRLDIFFLDREGRVIRVRRRVPPRRVIWCRGAAAVLEIPSPEGGEFARPTP